MSSEQHGFELLIMTPDRLFFHDTAQALIFDSGEGQMEILPNHAPLAASVAIGELQIKQNDTWKNAFVSEGFLTVENDVVSVFAQASEWPEEIDEVRAQNVKERAMRQLQHKQSIYEHQHTMISLTRAMERLRIKHK